MATSEYASNNKLKSTFSPIPDVYGSQAYYTESFDDKQLKGNRITDHQDNTVWTLINNKSAKSRISDTGALQLGGASAPEYAVLSDSQWEHEQNLAMEFTMRVVKTGNEGSQNRPVASIIPRTKDADFHEYYALRYFMENTVGNVYRLKWAIVNTAAPGEAQLLAQGYYLLRENTAYTLRLAIQNTDQGNVRIRFYADSPQNPAKTFEPIIDYTDSSVYRILESAKGPVFSAGGLDLASWGTPSVVCYDNIRLFRPDVFKQYEKQLQSYSLVSPSDIQASDSYGDIRYLLNQGIAYCYPDGKYHPNDKVTLRQLITMLIRMWGDTSFATKDISADACIKYAEQIGLVRENEFADINAPATKYDIALLINRFDGSLSTDIQYARCIKDFDDVPDEYRQAVLYAFYQGYLGLDDAFNFSGNTAVSRAECASILTKISDPDGRQINCDLELPSVLSSGAVLQRDKKIPVWGRGVCGDTITVKFKEQTITAMVKDGRWYAELAPEPKGGPYDMTVSSSFKKVVLKNLQMGEVFLVAGQSNCEMFLSDCDQGAETKKKLTGKPALRFYWGEKAMAVTPQFDSPGKWMNTHDYVLANSPAIGTFFAQKLLEANHDLSGVTIGLIRLSYGGTTIEAFMPDCVTGIGRVAADDIPVVSGFWNGYMDAVAPYAVKGVIYYQGENSTHLRYQYEPLLRSYIGGLRTEFKDASLPVMLVQLAGYGTNSIGTDQDNWPCIREVQMSVANTTSNTGLVSAVDLSDPDPGQIHPTRKKQIGDRLAMLAMNMIYGQDTQCESPQMKGYETQGNKVTVAFDHVYDTLCFKDGPAAGFEVLGADGTWLPAQAEINDDNTVTVWSDSLEAVYGARYAWYNYPQVSLFSSAGLPVLPFNTVGSIQQQ